MIQNGIVVNAVLASNEDLKDPNYLWVDITNVVPRPSIGWIYDGKNFNNPGAMNG